jgi:hypothetical protein
MERKMRANDISALYDELEALDAMTGAAACRYYNGDGKAEIRQAIIDWWYMTSPGEETYEDYLQQIKNKQNESH